MDNNYENNTPDTVEDVKPETTYTDPNAGATYTYGSVPKPNDNAEKEDPAQAEEKAYAAGNSEADSASADAGYRQPEERSAQTGTGYYQPGQNYSQPNNGYQQNYQHNNYSANYNSGYNNNYQNIQADGMDTSPLSMGEWLLTLLVALIPCAGLILYCIWAFGKTGNIHRRNFCRASLILQAISIVLSIVFVIFIAVAGVSSYSYYY